MTLEVEARENDLKILNFYPSRKSFMALKIYVSIDFLPPLLLVEFHHIVAQSCDFSDPETYIFTIIMHIIA